MADLHALHYFKQAAAAVSNGFGLDAGSMASWLYIEMRSAELSAIFTESRHVEVGLKPMRNQTDCKDTRGIAQLVRIVWFRRSSVKGNEVQRTRMLLVSRSHLLGKAQDIENCIRGLQNVFGLGIGAITKRI